MVDKAEERPLKIDAGLLELAAEQANRRGVTVDDLADDILRRHLQGESIRPAPVDYDEPTQDSSASYLAFISYSHDDSSIAAELHKRLERFRVPRTLIGQSTVSGPVPRRIRPVFRDEEEFSASADLGRSIRNALQASGSLIVVCSPRSARSAWVGEEIRYFKQLGRAASIFCLIIDGAPFVESRSDKAEGALHPALLEPVDKSGRRCEGEAPEPLAIDVREHGLDTAVVKVAAGVLNVGYEALHQRVRRQKRRWIISFTVLLAAIIASLTGLFVDGRLQKQRNTAQSMAVVAQQQLYAEDPLAGMALALQALDVSPGPSASLLEVARNLLTRGKIAALGQDIESIFAAEDGTSLVLGRAEGNGEMRSSIDGTLQETLPARLLSARYYAQAPGYFMLEYRLGDAELRRVDTGGVVARLKSPVTQLSFGPGHVFAQNSGGYPNQLLGLDSGAAVRFKGKARPENVVFGSEASDLMVISFFDGQRPQLRRTSDGSSLVLARPAAKISLSRDTDTSRLLVTYADGSIELLETADLSLIRRFDPDTRSAQAWSHGSRLMSTQLNDGSRRLVDMADGSAIASGTRLRRSRDPDRSLAAVISERRVSWYRAADASQIGEIPGRFSDVRFSRDSPPSRIAVKAADGWQLYSTVDASLIIALPGALTVVMDEHYLITTDNSGRELRALADGSLSLSLEQADDRVTFFSRDRALVEPESGSPRYHALPSGKPVKVPARRNIAFNAAIGPGKAYHLIAYTDGRTEIRDGPAGATLAWIEGKILNPSAISFLPETAASHILVSAPDVPSVIYPLKTDLEAIYPEGQHSRVTLPTTVQRVDLLPDDNPDYLLLRYSDGSAELWSGLEEMRRLARLDANLEDFHYMNNTGRLVLRYANGSAALIDLGWLRRATHPGITDKALFGLACDGPLRAFDSEVLQPYLHGEKWTACPVTD